MAFACGVSRHFFARSERVKAVALHPREPLVASAQYDGRLKVHNYFSLQLVAALDVSALPLRAAAFLAPRDWLLCAGDDCALRAFSLHSQQKVAELLNAHKDYIRHLAVHAHKPLVLSSSDDMTIKLWDVEDGWTRLCSFESHAHYVMQSVWSPRDPTIFASCSLDRSIKVWGIGPIGSGAKTAANGPPAVVTSAHFSLLGHERGVNTIAYSTGERPYLVSGADDATVRIWDYQTKQCIQVLSGHSKNVSAVLCPPGGPHALPLLFSAGEDGRLCLWRCPTFREEGPLDLGLERLWALAARPPAAAAEGGLGGLVLAVATDSGTLVLKMGKDGPVVSCHGGKAVVARGFELLQFNLKAIDENVPDGEKVQCPAKEIGNSDIFPQSISHHPNGRFIAVVGDGEYVIYTAQALRSKAFGAGEDLVWSLENHYAVLEKENRIKIFCNFEEAYNFTPPFTVEEIFGGYLLGVCSDDAICFYDWNSYRLIRRIEVCPTAVYWSPDGMQVAIVARDPLAAGPTAQASGGERLYVLRHDKYAVMAANTAQALEEEGGIPIAFELLHQADESVSSGLWVLDSFVYMTRGCRLCCFCAGRTQTLHALETQELRLLAYVPEHSRLYLISPAHALYAFTLHQAVVQYQGAIARGDLQTAEEIFPQLPLEAHDEAARTLQAHGYIAEALPVARDEQLRFELALSIGNLHMCAELIRGSSSSQAVQRQRWAAVGDAALQKGSFTLAAAAFWECGDYPSLLLLYSSSGDVERLRQLGAAAAAAEQQQIAFVCYLLSQQMQECVDLLLTAERAPEAALFARTYCPSAVDKAVKAWRQSRTAAAAAAAATTHGVTRRGRVENAQLQESEERVKLPAYPSEQPDAFPNWELAKQAEGVLSELYRRKLPAGSYSKVQQLLEADILQTIEEAGPDALRKLMNDAAPFSSMEDSQEQIPRVNGDVTEPLSGTPMTAAAGGPSPTSVGDALSSLSPDGWKQPQQQQQLQQGLSPPHQLSDSVKPQQQQLLEQQEFSSPLGYNSSLSPHPEHLQQHEQQMSNPFAAAANPFSSPGLAKDASTAGSSGTYMPGHTEEQQQQQFREQLHEKQLLHEQQQRLHGDAKRLGGAEWGDGGEDQIEL